MTAMHPSPDGLAGTRPGANALISGTKMSVLSAIVCTHNRSHYLRLCLDSFARQQPESPRCDLLVVDSASSHAEAREIAALVAAHGARLIRTDTAGLSVARNAGLAAARTEWVAYIDDDACVAPDWVASMHRALETLPADAAGLGGAVHPHWEAPCPPWWPREHIPALTILEWQTPGRIGSSDLPADVEPLGANMAFRASALREIDGFPSELGRIGRRLLSGEEAWVVRSLMLRGHSVHYDPAVAVAHSIQRERLNARWLTSRQFWSGVSEAIMMERLGERAPMLAKARRLTVHVALLGPLALWPSGSVRLLRERCALSFAAGFLRGAAAVRPLHRPKAFRTSPAAPVTVRPGPC